jgi:hypothetical protein
MAQYSASPYRLLVYLLLFLFFIFLNSQSEDEEMKIPPTDQPESPQCDIEIHPKITSEDGLFFERRHEYYKCILLFFIVIIIRGNKIICICTI